MDQKLSEIYRHLFTTAADWQTVDVVTNRLYTLAPQKRLG